MRIPAEIWEMAQRHDERRLSDDVHAAIANLAGLMGRAPEPRPAPQRRAPFGLGDAIPVLLAAALGGKDLEGFASGWLKGRQGKNEREHANEIDEHERGAILANRRYGAAMDQSRLALDVAEKRQAAHARARSGAAERQNKLDDMSRREAFDREMFERKSEADRLLDAARQKGRIDEAAHKFLTERFKSAPAGAPRRILAAAVLTMLGIVPTEEQLSALSSETGADRENAAQIAALESLANQRDKSAAASEARARSIPVVAQSQANRNNAAAKKSYSGSARAPKSQIDKSGAFSTRQIAPFDPMQPGGTRKPKTPVRQSPKGYTVRKPKKP